MKSKLDIDRLENRNASTSRIRLRNPHRKSYVFLNHENYVCECSPVSSSDEDMLKIFMFSFDWIGET